jgi:asparagine synthase (glutamine-hydrolysing)
MTDRLAHRGPDAASGWIDAGAGIALGHRRLSILDLSEAGAQPMVSHSGRYALSTNGEIYNHFDIRDELARSGAAVAWRGHSDTETMVAAFDRWGVEATLQRLVGMFAFAAWDRQERVLTLARDRLGEKPLYYGWQRGTLLFGSELKALCAHPDFAAPIDRCQLSLYLRRGYVPSPGSIYEGVGKLRPGCFARFGPNTSSASTPEAVAYWSIRDVVAEGERNAFDGSDEEALVELESTLGRAVAAQSVADVPLGAFLSGGIDSSAVVALLQASAGQPVKTFSIGFTEERFNEAPFARAVAAHLGTDHVELIVTPREAMDVIPRLPALYDEPFGDSSAIPTFLVSKLARRRVTVSLSGDGGDELFGGYTRYARAETLWRLLKRVPRPVRAATAGLFGRHLSRFVASGSPQDLYDRVMLDRDAPGIVRDGDLQPAEASVALDPGLAARSVTHAMMQADIETYLPDDILVKVDRASMGVSLESRVPLLDHRVVELAWRLPLEHKVRNGETKWLLRQLARKHLPSQLLDRPKKGFGVPVDAWVRTSLREWAEGLLDDRTLRHDGFLDGERVRAIWNDHVGGAPRLGLVTWRILMFQAWLAAARQA